MNPSWYNDEWKKVNHRSTYSVIWTYFFLAAPWGMWDPSSLTRDGTMSLCIGSMESPNTGTARKVPALFVLSSMSLNGLWSPEVFLCSRLLCNFYFMLWSRIQTSFLLARFSFDSLTWLQVPWASPLRTENPSYVPFVFPWHLGQCLIQ